MVWFYPETKKGFKGEGGRVVPFRLNDESLHIDINISDPNPDVKSECVISVYYHNE